MKGQEILSETGRKGADDCNRNLGWPAFPWHQFTRLRRKRPARFNFGKLSAPIVVQTKMLEKPACAENSECHRLRQDADGRAPAKHLWWRSKFQNEIKRSVGQLLAESGANWNLRQPRQINPESDRDINWKKRQIGAGIDQGIDYEPLTTGALDNERQDRPGECAPRHGREAHHQMPPTTTASFRTTW